MVLSSKRRFPFSIWSTVSASQHCDSVVTIMLHNYTRGLLKMGFMCPLSYLCLQGQVLTLVCKPLAPLSDSHPPSSLREITPAIPHRQQMGTDPTGGVGRRAGVHPPFLPDPRDYTALVPEYGELRGLGPPDTDGFAIRMEQLTPRKAPSSFLLSGLSLSTLPLWVSPPRTL